MKHNPRPFVVEVKRGTSRQSFQSHSSDSDKFSAAEKLLFSQARVEPVVAAAPQTKPGQSGRVLPVLPVLSDTHDIVLADPFPAPRRGRPPGSKNRVKPTVEALLSKALVAPMSGPASDIADVVPGTIDDRLTGQTQRDDGIFLTPVVAEAAVAPVNGPSRTARLRDRSRILRRYVLGIEPRAGERSSFRKRKIGTSNGKRER